MRHARVREMVNLVPKGATALPLALAGFVGDLQRLPQQQPDQLRVFLVPVEHLPDRLGHRVGIDGDRDADLFQLRPQDGGEQPPEVVAHAAVYLASGESAFVQGTVLDVDGGRVGVAVITV